MHGIELDNIELSDNRQLVIVGGVHGAGKSTFCRELQEIKQFSYLSPQEILKEIVGGCGRQEIYKILSERVREYMSNYQPFIFEHVMSGDFVNKLMLLAKENSYSVHLIYIDIDSADLACKRIDKRIASCGHDVERDKVSSRLEESRNKFYKDYKDRADSWDLYDNNEMKFRRVASFNQISKLTIYLEDEYECFNFAIME